MRGWLAGGGRLTIVGGTAGASSLAGLPDDLLPFRPRATTDISPRALQDFVGPLSTTVQTIPAMTGDRSAVHGRILAASGDQVIAAEATFGSGAVTLMGVDPTGDWLARTPASDAVWNRLVPPRSLGAQLVTGDDSQMLNALNTLPSLALPPIGGLLILLFGYILLVGPLNYLLLRRLDRREWAWVTMPLLVLGFAVAAYAVRQHPPRRSGDHQLGRDRARRAGHDRGHGDGLRRCLLPDPGDVPARGSPAARCSHRRRAATSRRASTGPRTVACSTSSRATRLASATWRSAMGRCGRSGPRSPSPVRR